MEIKGKVYLVGEEVLVNPDFKKRVVIIETDEKYPQKIEIEFIQDKCDDLDILAPNMPVTIHINLRGREYKDKKTGEPRFFNTIQGWKIEM